MRSLKKNKTDRLGRRQGYWEFYYDNGKLSSKGDFVNGVKVGYWEGYYSDGRLMFKGKYINDKFIYEKFKEK